MDRDQYFVVLHKGERKIKHNGRHSDPYKTQADAITSAIEAAHAAHQESGLSQVLIQGQDLLFRTEWTYGKDPYPPLKGLAQHFYQTTSRRQQHMSLGTILLIILVLLLIGALPSWPYSAAWGPAPAGVLGLVLIVVLILVLMGRV